MRKLLFLLIIIVSNTASAQVHLRIMGGKTEGEFSCESAQDVATNSGPNYWPFGEYYYKYTGRIEEKCTIQNKGRFGLGLKCNYKKIFAEVSPFLDFNSFNYSFQSAGNFEYFEDSAQNVSIWSGQSQMNGWPLNRDSTSVLGPYSAYSVGFSLNLGFQISERHSMKVFVSENRMSKSQFGQVLYGSSSNRRVVYFEGKGAFEVFSPVTAGINYEFMFGKHFFVGLSSSVMLRAKDQNGESFYLPAKRSMAISFNLGFQLPNKQERKPNDKKSRRSQVPQIL